MRRKQWVRVEALQRKIDLALDSHVVRDWEELGKKLDASPKTIRWWVQGSAGHDPGEMPLKAFKALCGLYAKLLTDEGENTVDDLVKGPTTDLDDALSRTASPTNSLLSFLHGVISGEARLVLFRDGPELVEVDRQKDAAPLPAVPLHAPFRIEFKPMPRVRGIVVLQNAGLRWGTVEAGKDRGGTAIFVPGMDDDGLPLAMREHEQSGNHNFYCVQSSRPLPASLKADLAEPIELDRRVLGMLSRFFERLSASERRCQVLALEIERRSLGV